MHKNFCLLLSLISFISIRNTPKSPAENIYDAMTTKYEQEHNKLLKMLDQLHTKKFSEKELGEALVEAAHFSNLTVVQAFIKAGANVNHVNTCKSTALIFAVSEGKSDIIQELIQAGADINHANVFGQTALWAAIENNNIAVVRELINANADINQPNKFGETPLQVAIENNQIRIIKELLQAPNIKINSEILMQAKEKSEKVFALFQPFINKNQLNK